MNHLNQEIWNIQNLGWRVAANEAYNLHWIKAHGLLRSSKSLEALGMEGLDVSDSHPHEVGWLKNIDRLIDMLPISFDPSNYDLLDVGCGSGISTLYFVDNYSFNSFAGIDFSSSLIDIASINLNLFSSLRCADYRINLSVADAREFIVPALDGKNIFIYMFNPFGYDTARVFIEKNLNTLRTKNAILALSWDTWIAQLVAEKWHKAIIRNPLFKLSLVFF